MDHPIRRIRVIVDSVLAELDDVFDEMYATLGSLECPTREPVEGDDV